MTPVEQVRARAAALTARRRSSWAAGLEAGELTAALKPPTEREALSDTDAVVAWRDAWKSVESETIRVEWQERSWPSAGRQRVPVRVQIVGADAVAEFAGQTARAEWVRLRDRAAAVRERLGDTDAVRRAVRTGAARLLASEWAELTTLLAVTTWVIDNPATGYRPRQVPIRGVDSKWLGSHRGILTSLVKAVTGAETLGLVDSDPLVRVRILDRALASVGPTSFAASVEQLSELPLQPNVVLMVENLESLLALPELPGVVAVHGAGYAVSEAARISWAAASPVLYWGDLDTNGFAILHRLRSHHDRVRSVLMNSDTLWAHRDLWVPEPKPATGELTRLTSDESRALDALRDQGFVRLEQERIPWDSYALPRLVAALAGKW